MHLVQVSRLSELKCLVTNGKIRIIYVWVKIPTFYCNDFLFSFRSICFEFQRFFLSEGLFPYSTSLLLVLVYLKRSLCVSFLFLLHYRR